MRVDELDYILPNELLARTPKELSNYEKTKLLVMNRKTQEIIHSEFEKCIDYFCRGDVLVLNNSKTIKADLFGWYNNKKRVHIQLACDLMDNNKWLVYSFDSTLEKNMEIVFGDNKLHCKLLEKSDGNQIWTVRFREKNILEIVNEIGRPIISPYVRKLYDIKYYQNEYAYVEGSTELPAAGKHFTKEILMRIKERGVSVCYITLHTGLSSIGISEENFEDHKMHIERIEVSDKSCKLINRAKEHHKRVFAVGTTVVRAIESCSDDTGRVHPFSGFTELYIHPGYRFKVCDAFFTNFHGQQTSRIAMAAAFTGKDLLKRGYQEAILKKYTFYEFGDTTLTI